MSVYTFGNFMFPKKTILLEDEKVSIDNFSIPLEDIKAIHMHQANQKMGHFYFQTESDEQFMNQHLKNSPKFVVVTGKNQMDAVFKLFNQMKMEPTFDLPDLLTLEKKKTLNAIETEGQKACPYCGSIELEFLGNDKKSFSVGKAVGGAALTGGVGTIAGFFGKKGKNDIWHCKSCGKTFELKR